MMFEDVQLKTRVSPEDRHTLLKYYRRLRRRDDNGDMHAFHQAEVLRNLFGWKFFTEVDVERNPCPHRIQQGQGYYCKLAQAKARELGNRPGYSTSCYHTTTPECSDPLKVAHDMAQKAKANQKPKKAAP